MVNDAIFAYLIRRVRRKFADSGSGLIVGFLAGRAVESPAVNSRGVRSATKGRIEPRAQTPLVETDQPTIGFVSRTTFAIYRSVSATTVLADQHPRMFFQTIFIDPSLSVSFIAVLSSSARPRTTPMGPVDPSRFETTLSFF